MTSSLPNSETAFATSATMSASLPTSATTAIALGAPPSILLMKSTARSAAALLMSAQTTAGGRSVAHEVSAAQGDVGTIRAHRWHPRQQIEEHSRVRYRFQRR